MSPECSTLENVVSDNELLTHKTYIQCTTPFDKKNPIPLHKNLSKLYKNKATVLFMNDVSKENHSFCC